MEWLKRQYALIVRQVILLFWSNRGTHQNQLDDEPPQPARAGRTEPLTGHDDRGKDIQRAGRWYFRKTILDQLDGYFFYIRNMKRIDPDSYKLYSRIGAIIISHDIWLYCGEEHHWFGIPGHGRLAFGAVSFASDDSCDDDDAIAPKFLYFHKYTIAPPEVQPFDGDIYAVTTFFSDRRHPTRRHWGLGERHHIGVNAAGQCILLKELISTSQTINIKNPRQRRRYANGCQIIHHKKWAYPERLIESYRDRCNRHKQKDDETIEIWAARCFRGTYDAYLNASLDIRVAVTSGNLTAAFSVDLLRTPYFFSDRDFEECPSGKRRRIFHIVRTHSRTLASGETTNVHSHFRGSRSFYWHGYKVHITMPGKHHLDILGFTAGAVDADMIDDYDGMVGFKKLGKQFAKHLAS
jgi:hypothetical protein